MYACGAMHIYIYTRTSVRTSAAALARACLAIFGCKNLPKSKTKKIDKILNDRKSFPTTEFRFGASEGSLASATPHLAVLLATCCSLCVCLYPNQAKDFKTCALARYPQSGSQSQLSGERVQFHSSWPPACTRAVLENKMLNKRLIYSMQCGGTASVEDKKVTATEHDGGRAQATSGPLPYYNNSRPHSLLFPQICKGRGPKVHDHRSKEQLELTDRRAEGTPWCGCWRRE